MNISLRTERNKGKPTVQMGQVFGLADKVT